MFRESPFISPLRGEKGNQMRPATHFAILSLFIALLVLALKTAAYWVTGSVALLSDALESIINVVVAGAAWVALRVSSTPPDDKHPFGHHKAEYFSAVLEGALIALAALAIFREAVFHFFTPREIGMPALGIAVNVTASIINAIWGIQLIKIGRREKSPALDADGQHVLADAVASTGVVAGVFATVITGWLQLDALVAGAVGVYILISGWKLVKESVSGLMDEAASPETLALIDACIAERGAGAIEAHDIRTRHAGPVTFIQFHLIVPSSMTVAAAHEICDRIEHALKDRIAGARVAIHIEPAQKAKGKGIQLSASSSPTV
jgi:cation diffusion facilitator family transporter